MYTLFLKIATRYLLKNKLYSFINIFGLAIGIASFVLIMLYVNYERSYDTFEGSENVYRVYMDYTENGVFVPGDAQSYNLSGPTLEEAFPEIKEYTRLRHIDEVVIEHSNEVLDYQKGAFAEASFLDVFQATLIKGDRKTILKDPYTIILTESLAKKIFGEEDPMGKTLSLLFGSKNSLKVTGILKDLPKNSHIKNDFLISFNSFKTWEGFGSKQELNWNNNDYYTYIKISADTNMELLKGKIMDLKVEALPFERHNIEPLEDIHLTSNKPFEAEVNGSITRVRFLLAIALIIIILSWLNYVNLATAKSLERAKEMGIRKVSGARRLQIMLQSFSESVLLNIIAIGLALVMVVAAKPFFNQLIGQELFSSLTTFSNFWFLLGFVLIGTMVSGIYPALVLSNYSPVEALKGKVSTSAGGLQIRKILVIIQFFATIVLLIGTVVVNKQIHFLREQPIGANLDQIIALHGKSLTGASDSLIAKKVNTLKTELEKLPYVNHTATAQTYPGGTYVNLSSSVGITFPNGTRDDKRIWYTYAVDPGYFDLMKMNFLAGRPFLKSLEENNNHIVINERFLKHMGIADPQEAIDKTVKFWSENWIIKGVIEDYYHFGLKSTVEPIILRNSNINPFLLVKLNQTALSTIGISHGIDEMERMYKGLFPERTFNYTFLDQNFEALYQEDRAFGSAFRIFTLLAILIASLGLFGLTSYTIIQRRKEVGIRKVNGASISQILSLLNKDLLKWVFLAFIIAVPISWYAMNKWLEGFAVKTNLNWWLFVLAGLCVLMIAVITVSWHSYKAATLNPVDALRDE